MGNAENHKQEPYGFIKNLHLIEAAYFDQRLQEQTKLTLALLVRYADQDGSISWFSIKETANRKGVTRRAIQNQLNKLVTYEYLAHESNKGVSWRNKYHLLFKNLNHHKHVTPLGDTPHVTQVDDTPVTPSSDMDVTQLNDTMKTLENNERKKEKNVRVHNDFLELVKEEIEKHAFQEIGNLSEEIILIQATACWQAWDGDNNFPKGNPISKFKGWVRTGLRRGSIKETSSNPKNSNALQGEHVAKPENPIQDWHRRVKPIVGDDVYKAWLRPCWHDGNGKLYAPTKFSAQRIEERYKSEINQVLPNVSISHQPYKEGLHEKPL